ncbi:[FeFe] hydrogenase H-cluster radical SAM maturase HydE [uncultured Clostridium sp.]|uniref:[FeFe] hydrogenase H-cluster radical SAM maturase HydE n=1 Tax=uncultured Clostridium sp. TaxID=59620 RepID=UPI0025F67038|nr:[FeFe] hydrogenase H-cluster radical SAM maturase HydE [uncultured Clostridium sp.]
MRIQLNDANDASELTNFLNDACKRELSEILRFFLQNAQTEILSLLACRAEEIREKYYGRKIYFRGLIEFSSFCKNNCYYCGIRRGNFNARRYRLSDEEILNCCTIGYRLGYRTFVLQSGEDVYYTDERLCRIVSAIKTSFPDSAVTLSLGERSRDSYRRLFDAGADRYLLRHETADETHYRKLHPPELSLENRMQCLYNLKEIGYQVGSGFMVDSPYQTYDTLAEDFIFLRDLQPHMVGIGPFIPHKDTKFANYYKPSSRRTVILLSLLRFLLPKSLLPATTALGTIDPIGREKGFKASANVVMPNLSPIEHRRDYSLYDNKICMGEESAECFHCIAGRIQAAGFVPDFSKGDHFDWQMEAPNDAFRSTVNK